MAEKFKNKYRISSARLLGWDYGRPGCYFITICANSMECLFGSVVDGGVTYSPIGQIVIEEWEKSFQIRHELFCDVFVLMPNHLHAILRIAAVEPHDRIFVEPHDRAALQKPENHGVAYRAPRSVSSFVAGFKSSATKRINQYRQSPKTTVWQERFHDHIIRNESEYRRIFHYILRNPANWNPDKFYKQ